MATSPFDPDGTSAGKPPLGVAPNLINPPSQGYNVVVGMSVYLLLTTPIVLARMYTRYYINHRLWWDDCKTSP